MALNVFGSAPAGFVPFTEPEQGDDFTLKDNVGATVILTVVGPDTQETTAYGVKPVVRLSRIVVLKDGAEPVVYTDVLLFESAAVSQLSASAGQQVVAGVVTYTNKYTTKDKPFFVKFGEPTPEGIALANAFTESEVPAPF